ncbi:hypothetical protein RHECNPAF_2330060 [Rhizobium etli CNPAF512]|nr:hypothetical protein RHECNPAF_2330060 [Rhizobium etli CNPAF512]
MPEGLEARHGKALARLELALRRCLDTGTDNFAAIGAEVDDHCKIGRRQFGKMEADRRKTEKDEKELNQEGRVADQLDIGRNDRFQPSRAECPHPGAENAERNAKHPADRDKLQGDHDALDDVRVILKQPAEFEMVAQGMSPLAVTGRMSSRGRRRHAQEPGLLTDRTADRRRATSAISHSACRRF